MNMFIVKDLIYLTARIMGAALQRQVSETNELMRLLDVSYNFTLVFW